MSPSSSSCDTEREELSVVVGSTVVSWAMVSTSESISAKGMLSFWNVLT